MANELQQTHTTGKTVYANIIAGNGADVGKIWSVTGSAFEAYSTANFGNYDIALTEQGTASQIYLGTFDASIVAGLYFIQFREQAGGSPAESDTIIGTETLTWDGSAVVRSFAPVTDTVAEHTQAQPAAAPTYAKMFAAWWSGFRQGRKTTATEDKFEDDAGTVIFKRTISDDGTTFTATKMVSGP